MHRSELSDEIDFLLVSSERDSELCNESQRINPLPAHTTPPIMKCLQVGGVQQHSHFLKYKSKQGAELVQAPEKGGEFPAN